MTLRAPRTVSGNGHAPAAAHRHDHGNGNGNGNGHAHDRGASERADTAARRVLELTTRSPREALRLARRELADGRGMPAASRARLLRAHGHALRAVGEYLAARLAYRFSRRIFARLGDRIEWAVGAIGLVDACMYLGAVAEAREAAAGARREFIVADDRRHLAMLESNLGNLDHREERLVEALAHYERASRLMRDSGSAVESAIVDHNHANVLVHLGRRREAELLLTRARQVFETSGEQVLASQTRYGISCLRFLSGEYAAAITELEGIRSELRRLGARPLLALADLDLAEVLLSMRLYPEALVLAQAAEGWFAEQRVPIERARCLLVGGTCMAQLGRRRSAVAALARAGALFRSERVKPGLAAIAAVRASLALHEGSPLAAVRHARLAFQKFSRAGFGIRALAAGAMGAEALLAAGRTESARNLARLLGRLRRQPGDVYSRARLLRAEGAAAAREGDLRAALVHYRAALRESARIRSALFVDEWRVGFVEGEPATLDEALGIVLRRRPSPRPAEIWSWLAESGDAPGPGARLSIPHLTPELRERRTELRRELAACYGRLWHHRAHGVRRLDSGTARRLEASALRLEGRLRRLAAVPHITTSPTRAAHGRRSQTTARGDALHYFSAGGQLCAIASDAHGDRLVRNLVPSEEIARCVRLLHYQLEVLSSPAGELARHHALALARAEEHLAALSAFLLAPVYGDRELPRALRVVPHGPLFRVPFHALPWRGAPVVEHCRVSLQATHVTRPAAEGPRRSGALVLGHGDEPRSAIEREAREIGRMLAASGVAVRLRVGSQATREAVLESVGEVELVHLAGHAVYRSEHPEFSALRLHAGWLHARDFGELGLDGACVVLSACETGPRGAVAGEEMLGLIRGLERAGARTVLASLWRVDDDGTRRFMRELYSAWQRLGTLGEALQEVQRASARSGRSLYLWAPFCLLGDPGVAWPGAAVSAGRH